MNWCFGSKAYAPVDTFQKTNKYSSPPDDAIGKPADERSGFPGITARAQCNSRNMTKQHLGNPASLVPTSGNALMEYDPNTMADLVTVTVPAGSRAGNIIEVISPDSSGKSAQVMIPFGCTAGSTFLVKMPSDQDQGWVVNDLHLQEEKADLVVVQSSQSQDYTQVKDMEMLVTAPKGVSAGTTIHVLVPGQGYEKRYLPVTIPEGGVSQFHVQYNMQDTFVKEDGFVKSQKIAKQNWHKNPLAVAPMIVGPLLLL
jgi:hypothetical protein